MSSINKHKTDRNLCIEQIGAQKRHVFSHKDGCFLRFDNRDSLEESVDSRFDRGQCQDSVNVTLKSVKNGGFGRCYGG
ncbi:unnamed protein product [Cochlearia groenlandica]